MRTADMIRERPLDPPLAFSSLSRDGGRTWSTAQPEPDMPNYRAKSFFGRDARERSILRLRRQRRAAGAVLQNPLAGGEWSPARTFYAAEKRNSYPTLIEGQPGRWLAVWESSGTPDRPRTAIRFGRLEVAE